MYGHLPPSNRNSKDPYLGLREPVHESGEQVGYQTCHFHSGAVISPEGLKASASKMGGRSAEALRPSPFVVAR